MTNPWSLSPAEVRVMDSIIETGGSRKLVSHSLGISLGTVYDHTQSIRTKMKVRGGLAYIINWIKFRIEHPKENDNAEG